MQDRLPSEFRNLKIRTFKTTYEPPNCGADSFLTQLLKIRYTKNQRRREEKSYSEESERGLNAILDAAALVVNLDAENSRRTNATLIVRSNILHLAANARAIIGRDS